MLYRNHLKLLLDFTLAFFGLLFILPLFLSVTVLLFIFNQGNPFFLQSRPGKKGKIFKVVKFKTMNNLKDESGKLLPDEKRLTVIGKVVRKTSLDEVPQLLNVIKGDMSLVGPRPLLVEYLPLYSDEQKRRHEVRPGITGWAQVNGRNAINWEEKFAYDVWYVDHLSFWLDIKIMLLTVLKVFKSEGISATGEVTMHKFKGSRANS